MLNNPETNTFMFIKQTLYFLQWRELCIINEDSSKYLLLRYFKKKELISWKHKIKNLAIKHIKEKPITQR